MKISVDPVNVARYSIIRWKPENLLKAIATPKKVCAITIICTIAGDVIKIGKIVQHTSHIVVRCVFWAFTLS